ncbi:BEND2 protein, partial [Centropus bengalensis]|nr:BEND2 protein [Centropus bengalensis]
MRSGEGEYEDSDSVVYEYEPDYECGSIVSEASYTGDQQKTLMEVLCYCQAMYDAIQKLDRKFDLLHRKVSEMQHTRLKPLLLKPVIIRAASQSGHVQVNSMIKHVPPSLHLESQQPVRIQSPPLPTIVSTHSLGSPFTAANKMPDLSPQSDLVASVVESTVNVASSTVASSSMPTPPESSWENNAFVGDPVRNVKILGNYLMKARQKTKPKYAARYLVRILFPKETLLCSIMGASARGRRTLDPNKIAAIREFLATSFPSYDLRERGKDWKTCITNVNAMIRCLRSETKVKLVSCLKAITCSILSFLSQINYLNSSSLKCYRKFYDTSHCGDSNYSEDREGNRQKKTNSTTDALQNSELDKNFSFVFLTCILELLGSPWRDVQLPFSVIYVAKGKSRPELSARYLIRHLFTEDVLIKSNVYGSLERGMSPLDSNKINALRDFLQENFPSFDLKETGYDWKACVAAINSTIRSLRHEHKKAKARN